MQVTPLPFENLFELKIDNISRLFRHGNFVDTNSNVTASLTPVTHVSVESVIPTTPTTSEKIPWGRIILITAIAAGIVYVGYRVYKKHQESQKKNML